MAARPRPKERTIGAQSWRRLAFIHWPIAPESIERHLPAGLEVDVFEGKTYVGLIPFAMRSVRARWMPRFVGLHFLETNLRCYVRCRDEPGVFFFSLEAGSRLAVKVARFQFGLPYYHADMSLEIAGDEITYRSKRRDRSAAALRLGYRIGPPLPASEPGTLQHFLIERRILFAQRRGALVRAEVHHHPYPLRAAELLELEQTLTNAAGLELSDPVATVHYSPGVDVGVSAPGRVD